MRLSPALGPFLTTACTALLASGAAPWLLDRTAESGLTFEHDNGATGSFFMPENMGAGGALVDVDNDGDLVLARAGRLPYVAAW